MMHQESRDWSCGTKAACGATANSMDVLAYRSRAVSPPTRDDLDRILVRAQERNRVEGLTGLLIYDQGCFFQWLEGPKLGLMRVWDSIRHDARHTDLKILRQQPVPARFFKGWDMRIALRKRGEIDKVLAVMMAPQDLLDRLRILPSALSGKAWDQVFAEVVIPRLKSTRLKSTHLRQVHPVPPGPAMWHARSEAAAELAGILLVHPGETAAYVDDLMDQGAGLEPIYHEVFEPAARCLGGWWDDDRCDEFNLTLAMGRLQVEVRRLSTALPAKQCPLLPPGHSVLVAPQPGEPHGLNAAMCSELFSRDGWDVSCENPETDNVLRELVHDQWFDVLELSLSDALRRDQQLPAMRFTIRAARAASLNPGLAVIVDGRSFLERPAAYLDVGADAGCGTSTDAVAAAQQLLDALSIRNSAAVCAPAPIAITKAAESLVYRLRTPNRQRV